MRQRVISARNLSTKKCIVFLFKFDDRFKLLKIGYDKLHFKNHCMDIPSSAPKKLRDLKKIDDYIFVIAVYSEYEIPLLISIDNIDEYSNFIQNDNSDKMEVLEKKIDDKTKKDLQLIIKSNHLSPDEIDEKVQEWNQSYSSIISVPRDQVVDFVEYLWSIYMEE